jgi:hypothetical protein
LNDVSFDVLAESWFSVIKLRRGRKFSRAGGFVARSLPRCRHKGAATRDDFRRRKSNMTNIFKDKLIPVALAAALLGGTVGALGVGATMGESEKAARFESLEAANLADAINFEEPATRANPTVLPQYLAAANTAPAVQYVSGPRTVVVRNQPSVRYVNRSTRARTVGSRTYAQPQKRSFWSKHRDKLTVAIGAGAGAALGGAFGGKKGALIGGLAGAGGSALYTYKIRNRTKRY